MAPHSPEAVAAFSVACAIAGLSTGATGFGRSILFHVFVMVVVILVEDAGGGAGVLTTTVSILSVGGACAVGPLAIASFSKFNPGLAILLTAPSIICTVVFTAVLLSTPEEPIKLALGICLFVFAAWRWYWTFSHPPPPAGPPPAAATTPSAPQEGLAQEGLAHRSTGSRRGRCCCAARGGCGNPSRSARVVPTAAGAAGAVAAGPGPVRHTEAKAARQGSGRSSWRRLVEWVSGSWPTRNVAIGAALAGAGSGITTGLVSVGGPPVMVFVALAGLDKSEVRATFTMLSAISSSTQVVQLISAGVVVLDDWPLYVATVLASWLGLGIGFFMHDKLSQRGTTRLVLALLSISGAMLLGRRRLLDTGVAAAGIGGIAVFWWLVYRTSLCSRPSTSKVVPAAMLGPPAEPKAQSERISDVDPEAAVASTATHPDAGVATGRELGAPGPGAAQPLPDRASSCTATDGEAAAVPTAVGASSLSEP